MAYKGWKELERRHAKRLKGKRLWRPDFGESMPDGETDRETWDAKYSVRPVKLLSLFAECERKYRDFTGKRNFHMVFYGSQTSALGDIVACTAARYADLLEKEALLDSHVAAFISVTESPLCPIHGPSHAPEFCPQREPEPTYANTRCGTCGECIACECGSK